MNRSIALFALAAVVGLATSVSAGDFKGRIVYDGKAPDRAKLAITADQAFCGMFNLEEENLVVNPENGGLRDVFVYIYVKPGGTVPPAEKPEGKDKIVVLDNKNCRFAPHAVTVWTEQILVLQNSDPKAHNSKLDFWANAPQNPTLPANTKKIVKLTKGERLPANVSCGIHPWMAGLILVQEHPYMAISDENGDFEIKNIPAGDWTFQFWHKSAGYLSAVNVNGANTEWTRGRVDQKIADSVVDLGDVKVDPSLFK